MLLKRFKVDPLSLDEYGNTALESYLKGLEEVPSRVINVTIEEMLTLYPYRQHPKPSGRTVLMDCVSAGYDAEVLLSLINDHLDKSHILLKDNSGDSILHIAAKSKNYSILDKIITCEKRNIISSLQNDVRSHSCI